MAQRHLSLRHRTLAGWIFVVTIVAAWLCFVPLFNLLGYEFCVIIAATVSIANLWLGASMVTDIRREMPDSIIAQVDGFVVFGKLLGRGLKLATGTLVPPLILISLNQLRVPNCNYREGLLLYLLLPTASAFLSITLGILAGTLTRSRAVAILVALAAIVGSIAHSIYDLYSSPAVFAYDPFYGYFAGPIYDEAIAVSDTLVRYRLYNLVALIAALLVTGHFLNPPTLTVTRSAFIWRARHLAVTGLFVIATLTAVLFRDSLGFAASADQIQQTLGNHYATEHFDIYYDSTMRSDIRHVAEDHEFRYTQLATVTGTASMPRITSYIFRSPEQKRQLIGAARTSVAKPWRAELYLQQQPFPHPVLKHELAHVMLANFGVPLLGLSFTPLRLPVIGIAIPLPNLGLIEGIAVALDWRPLGESDLHQWAAARIQSGALTDLAKLFGPGFYAASSRESYVLAGSFCRYLLAQYKFAAVAQIYRQGGNYSAITGHSLDALLTQWQDWLKKGEIPETVRAASQEYFRVPSIWRRQCAHEVANLRRAVSQSFNTNEIHRTTELINKLIRFDPNEPRHLHLKARQMASLGKFTEAIAILDHAAIHPAATKPFRRQLLEAKGDFLYLSSRNDAAARAYHRSVALEQTATKVSRTLLLKNWALSQPAPVTTALFEYLLAPSFLRKPGNLPSYTKQVALTRQLRRALAQVGLNTGLGWYLEAKQWAAQSRWTRAAEVFDRAIAQGLPLVELEREAFRARGHAAYLAGQLAQAEQAWQAFASRSDLAPAEQQIANEWLERIAWRKSAY